MLAFHSTVCPHMALQVAASRTVMSATGMLETGMAGISKRIPAEMELHPLPLSSIF